MVAIFGIPAAEAHGILAHSSFSALKQIFNSIRSNLLIDCSRIAGKEEEKPVMK